MKITVVGSHLCPDTLYALNKLSAAGAEVSFQDILSCHAALQDLPAYPRNQRPVRGDVRNRAIAKAAAGSDARMSGCELPVVINSGSGNQGITVSVPVIEYAKALAVPKDRLYRALALSNLIAIHEKTGIGRLSAYCGAVSAGCAAGCGIAYLQGADLKAISHTLVNSLAIVSGIICDGAKPSCAAKIASSVQAGIMGYHMYQNGQQFRGGDGIVTKGVENTIRNVSQLGREGMRETDKEIVKIMLQES